MNKFTHVASSSKLLRSRGFASLAEAEQQAQEWERQAPVGAHDAESPATVYTWQEWCSSAEQNEADPLEGLENYN